MLHVFNTNLNCVKNTHNDIMHFCQAVNLQNTLVIKLTDVELKLKAV